MLGKKIKENLEKNNIKEQGEIKPQRYREKKYLIIK